MKIDKRFLEEIEAIGDDHEDTDKSQADQRRRRAGTDRCLTERWTDRPFIDELQFGWKLTRFNDGGEVFGFFQCEVARDPDRPGINRLVDPRRRHDLVIQHNREELAAIICGRLTEVARALTIEGKTRHPTLTIGYP